MIGHTVARPPSSTLPPSTSPRARGLSRRSSARPAIRALLIVSAALVALVGTAVPAAAVVPGVNWPVQSLGNRGTDVLTIQRMLRVRLARTGTTLPPVNALFQAPTVTAVKAWQTRRGVAPTGIVDAASWAALVVPVKAGNRGDAVLALQVQLREKRRATIAADGVFGATTTAAVVSFQKHMGLTASGVVNVTTWRALVGHFELPRFSTNQLCDYSVGNGAANWGTATAIDTLEAVGRSMVVLGYGRIAVGDISYEHPGDIPGHVSHERGLDVDVRPMRKANDQCRWGSRWTYTTYDRAATRAMIKKIRALAVGHIKLIYFNDPVLIREGLTRWYSGHDDHIHVRFCEKIHPIAAYDC